MHICIYVYVTVTICDIVLFLGGKCDTFGVRLPLRRTLCLQTQAWVSTFCVLCFVLICVLSNYFD